MIINGYLFHLHSFQHQQSSFLNLNARAGITERALETDFPLTVEQTPAAGGTHDIAIILLADFSFTFSTSVTLAGTAMADFFIFKFDISSYAFVSTYSLLNAMDAEIYMPIF